MMKIPYLKIMEIRSLKKDLDNSDASLISRWLYSKGYNLQCKPIIKILKKSKNQINYIYNTDLIEFAKFCTQTISNHDNIIVHVATIQGIVYCSLDFIDLNCSLKADSLRRTIQYIQYTPTRDITKELISLNTGVDPYKRIYNAMIDLIIHYILEGEI